MLVACLFIWLSQRFSYFQQFNNINKNQDPQIDKQITRLTELLNWEEPPKNSAGPAVVTPKV